MERKSNPNLSACVSLRNSLLRVALMFLAFSLAPVFAYAQTTSASSLPIDLDHVVAVVGDQAVLQSDVEEEMRFTALQSTGLPASENTPEHALNRLIDRALIDNERLLQPSFSAVNEAQVQRALYELKKTIPACVHAACSTIAGWRRFLAAHGFTEQQAHDRILQRLQLLKFIDWRFGSAVRITQKDVQAYYNTVLLAEFTHETISPPPLANVANRIRQILQQQRITGLMDDWLKSLRAQGEVHIVDPAYGSVGGPS